MSGLPAGRLIGRAAAESLLSQARARIEQRNQLARAVRLIYAQPDEPVARLTVRNPRRK